MNPDTEVLAEAVEWLQGLDESTVGSETAAAIRQVREVGAQLEDLRTAGSDPEAIEFVESCLIRLLVMAQVFHEAETSCGDVRGRMTIEVLDGDGPASRLSREEFEARHITPLIQRGRRIRNRMRRRVRPVVARHRGSGGRPRARRTAARRAAGVRSGNDPGDDDPAELAPSRSRWGRA